MRGVLLRFLDAFRDALTRVQCICREAQALFCAASRFVSRVELCTALVAIFAPSSAALALPAHTVNVALVAGKKALN